MTMGQRILAARLAAGLSQRELAGEEITRNMLSSLEHDNANPSLSTLVYLSRRLERPVSWLLGEERSTAAAEAFECGDYRRARELMDAQERRWLEPLALLREAEQALESGRVPYARELLAQLSGKSSPLYGPELRRKAALLRCRCGDATDIPEDGALLQKARAALADQRPEDARRYLAAIDNRSQQWHYLMAESLFQLLDHAAALEHYHLCETAFQVRDRLETCYLELKDYKMAYFYRKK